MAISTFKATCLATLERVRRTGRPVRITRFGTPVADIVPPAASATASPWMGSLRGTLELDRDLISPSSDEVAWDALK
jgi:prevent-host-death family protein